MLSSFCPRCHKKLQWYELIPVISYVISNGRCRGCKQRISFLYPLTELIAAGITVTIFLKYGITWITFELLFFFLISFTIAVIDWNFLSIPNIILLAGLMIGIFLKAVQGKDVVVTSLISSLSAFATLLAVMIVGNASFKKQTMGSGDVKLAGIIGLFLGYTNFLISLWISAIIGSLFGVIMKNKKIDIDDSGDNLELKIPFGAFFSITSFFILLFQNNVKEIVNLCLIAHL